MDSIDRGLRNTGIFIMVATVATIVAIITMMVSGKPTSASIVQSPKDLHPLCLNNLQHVVTHPKQVAHFCQMVGEYEIAAQIRGE